MTPSNKTTIRNLGSLRADNCAKYSESFCKRSRNAFVEAGLIDDPRQLSLHATLVNTVYVSARERPHTRGERKERLVFDARNLIVSVPTFLGPMLYLGVSRNIKELRRFKVRNEPKNGEKSNILLRGIP